MPEHQLLTTTKQLLLDRHISDTFSCRSNKNAHYCIQQALHCVITPAELLHMIHGFFGRATALPPPFVIGKCGYKPLFPIAKSLFLQKG